MGMFLLPVSIPGWLFGFFYVGISIYGIKSKKDNIGHEAHLGGTLIGMIVAIVLFPGGVERKPCDYSCDSGSCYRFHLPHHYQTTCIAGRQSLFQYT